jgi:hypothetical protein
MIARQKLLLSSLALVAFTLAGCASNSRGPAGSAGGSPPTSVQVYTATLSPAEEVPPAAESKGTGTAEVRVNTNTNELTWKVTYSGMTGPVTAGHIHGPAARGANAGVVIPFANLSGTGPTAEGKATITPAQYGDLAAGLYYVNLHTAKYPGGELRGQLMRRP